MELTKLQVETAQSYVEGEQAVTVVLPKYLAQGLCSMALRPLQSDSRAVEVLRELVAVDGSRPPAWTMPENPDADRIWNERYVAAWEAARSVLSPTAPDDQDSASDVHKQALVSHDAAARADMVWVPKEPTREMLDAALRAMGAYCEPYDPEYEEGVEVSCGMSQADADHINEQQREAQADQYRAMIAARPE